MASLQTYQFLNSANPGLSMIEGSFQVGAAGAVSSGTVIGRYVAGVTRLKAGVYQIQLSPNANYNRIVGVNIQGIAGVTGASVAVTALVSGTLYSITAVGNTDWTAISGYPDQVTPAIGVSFVAGGTGTGTGTVKAVGTCGWDHAEQVGNPNTMINPSVAPGPNGALVIVQMLLAGSVADPTNGSAVRFELMFRNSSLLASPESASNY